MKKIYFIFALLLTNQLGQAQVDTTFHTTEEIRQLETQHITSLKDCFLCKHGDVKRIFKFGYSTISAIHQPLADYVGSINYLPIFILGYEQRIATGFSINTSLSWSHLRRPIALVEDISEGGILLYRYNSSAFENFNLSIEPRWYFHKKQQIKAGKSGNNLNGIYLGLQLS